MKKYLLILSGAALFFMASCSKGGSDSGTGGGPAPVEEKPTVRLSKTSIAADGFDVTTISVFDKNNVDITGQCFITVNNVQVSGLEYSTTNTGTFSVKAKKGNAESPAVSFTASDPGPSRYSQKVLAEDYTGAWCGYCPRVAYSLDQAHAANPGITVVAVHNGDPMALSFEGQLRSRYGVNSWPSVIVNRDFKWNEQQAQLANQTTKWAPLGLAIESTVSGNNISGRVRTQYNVTTNHPMVVGIMLVEDGIAYPQTNYYNTTSGSPFFGQGNPIPGYIHNHTLRKMATGVFGDAIPATAQVKDNIYDKSFSFDATGYNLSKCYVVAFVAYSDASSRTGTLNTQIVKAGLNQNFD
jgi:thiol-disulfide isomerase/thioredoxin